MLARFEKTPMGLVLPLTSRKLLSVAFGGAGGQRPCRIFPAEEVEQILQTFLEAVGAASRSFFRT